MKLSSLFLAALATSAIAGGALAGPDLHAPLPAPAQGPMSPHPMPSAAYIAPVALGKGPSGNVDKVLEQISRNMQPAPDLIDAQAEIAINRDMNLSRSTGQLLRPVGFMQIEDQRVVFASEDGVRVLRLKENSRLGVMKISKISEFGVEYTVSGKSMYAPLAYMASDPPKTPQQGPQVAQSTQQAPSAQPGTVASGR